MNPKVKVWVKWMRITQLVLRCLQVLCAGGLLAFMIIIRGMDDTTTWILRIAVSRGLLNYLLALYLLSLTAWCRSSSYRLWHLPFIT
jgi:hypothetical protein